jgi:hypothetical protein
MLEMYEAVVEYRLHHRTHGAWNGNSVTVVDMSAQQRLRLIIPAVALLPLITGLNNHHHIIPTTNTTQLTTAPTLHDDVATTITKHHRHLIMSPIPPRPPYQSQRELTHAVTAAVSQDATSHVQTGVVVVMVVVLGVVGVEPERTTPLNELNNINNNKSSEGEEGHLH